MRLLHGPLKLRLAATGAEAAELAARIARDGLVLAAEGEEADLVASPLRGSPARSEAGQASDRQGSAPGLSARELEILEYLADGWSNAEIASALGIGVRTVRFHLESINAKLGTSRRGEAVREGVRLGLVSFEV